MFLVCRSCGVIAWVRAAAVGLVIGGWMPVDARAAPLAPNEERATFELADSELEIELVAAEPDVESPVAICWDAAGAMYVAEMRDYPHGAAAGSIRRLEDRDGDGRYESSTPFAEGLNLPNGVLCVAEGVLVTAAPDLWLLRDADGDGRCDERRRLWTGFGEGNPQLRANGLVYGLDNRIYGANGRSDGAVHRPDESAEQGVSLRGRDFRLRADGSRFESLLGQSQFGQTRDDWGARFLSWNTIAVRHVVWDTETVERRPWLASSAVRNIADPAELGEVYRRTPRPQTFNRESPDFFNALCGLTVYRGDALGAAYAGSVFAGESLGSLVHRRTLEVDGPTFVSRRAERGQEFLAARDPWFHPVNFATGPDGALYVVDFYRRWVEHPQFVPPERRDDVDWQEGAGHGRIWRIRPRTGWRYAVRPLANATTEELVAALESTNGWQRDTAQRLLVERGDRGAVPALADCLARGPALAVVHALWTLEGLRVLDDAALTRAFAHSDARVRVQALRVVAGRDELSDALRAAVDRLAADADIRVRCALAAQWARDDRPADAHATRLAGLLELARWPDVWSRQALLVAAGAQTRALLTDLMRRQPDRFARSDDDDLALWEQLARQATVETSAADSAALLRAWLPAPETTAGRGHVALVAGWLAGVDERGEAPIVAAIAREDVASRLAGVSQLGLGIGLDARESLTARRMGWHAWSAQGVVTDIATVLELFAADVPPGVVEAAAMAVARVASREQADDWLNGWPRYSTGARRAVLAGALRSRVTADALASAIAGEQIAATELDPAWRQALLRIVSDDDRAALAPVFERASPAPREVVLTRYRAALDTPGDAAQGRQLFRRHCAVCHVVRGVGARVGPDLSGVAQRTKEALLIDLLDPSRQMSPDYLAYTVVTSAGQVFTGLLGSETAATIVLRRAEGAEDVIARAQVEELAATGKSLMPEGFEQTLSVEEVAHVLEFLTRPDVQP